MTNPDNERLCASESRSRQWNLIANAVLPSLGLGLVLLLLIKVANEGRNVSPPVASIAAVLALLLASTMRLSLPNKARVCMAAGSLGFALVAIDAVAERLDSMTDARANLAFCVECRQGQSI